jgi:hypothetical protein
MVVAFLAWYAVSAAALAWWIDQRWPRLAPGTTTRLVPAVIGAGFTARLLVEVGSADRVGMLGFLLGSALVALVMTFLIVFWVARLVSRSIPH